MSPLTPLEDAETKAEQYKQQFEAITRSLKYIVTQWAIDYPNQPIVMDLMRRLTDANLL